jgi:hypothetical protein
LQNRYVGDIGDFVKLSLLRALCYGQRLGVIWWLVPDESHNKDGRHIAYQKNSTKWRQFDPELFDALCEVVRIGDRSVAALESAEVLPLDTLYIRDEVPLPSKLSSRASARICWFQRAVTSLQDSSVVFIDPDNGLEPERFRPASKASVKSVRIDEVSTLRNTNRALIIYHHQTRMRGGHTHELHHLARKLRALGTNRVDALRAKPYSPRAFFLVDATDEIRGRAADFAARWSPYVTWHQNLM